MGPKSKHKAYLCFIYLTHTHTGWRQFYTVFLYCNVLIMTHMRWRVESSTCSIMLALKKFQILENFKYWIFVLGILNLYMYPMLTYSTFVWCISYRNDILQYVSLYTQLIFYLSILRRRELVYSLCLLSRNPFDDYFTIYLLCWWALATSLNF